MTEALEWIVICLDEKGTYVQATRTRFASHQEALKYADGIAKGRRPIVVGTEENRRERKGK